MRARVIFFRHLNCPEERDPNRLLLIKARAQEQRDRLRLFLFFKAGISRKPKTRSWKRCKACHPSDNRARATGERRQISIPDKKKVNSIIGVRDPRICAEQGDEVPTHISLSDRTHGRKTGLVAENNFLIDADNPALATDSKTTGYLALNWQSPKREVRFTCRDGRFPTPVRQGNTARNNRAIGVQVTTRHLFWPNEKRRRGFPLPSRLPNANVLAANCDGPCQEGAGGSDHRSAEKCCIDRPVQKFSPKWPPCPIGVAEKMCRAARIHPQRSADPPASTDASWRPNLWAD
jgi:hypothetical protein